MTGNYGYWVDLQTAKLSETDEGSWIQAFPEGTYQHPVYGEMKFDAPRLKRFADSVASKVRGIDPDIDYDHKMFSGEAAGWVRKAEYTAGEGLRILVEWTPKARAAIANKEYRYFSPEFTSEWEHPKTGKVHEDVLNGGALTNRPFLKDILPVNLSELVLDETPTPEEENPTGGLMDPKELRRILGLAEDATDEQVNAKVAQLKQLQEVISTPPADPAPAPTPPSPPKTEKSVEQLLAELGQVGNNPAVTMLGDIIKAQSTKLQAMERDARDREIEVKLNDLDRGKKFAVPPAVKDQLRQVMKNSPKELGDQVYSLYSQQIELGLIDLTEHGWQRQGEPISPVQALNAEVAKLMEADKNLSYRQAYDAISANRPDLAGAVRQDSYIRDGV